MLNKKVRRLFLPFPVYGKGAGDGSLFADSKLQEYRQNLYAGAKLPVCTRSKHKISIEIARPKVAQGEGAKTTRKGWFYSFQAVGRGVARLKLKGISTSAEVDLSNFLKKVT